MFCLYGFTTQNSLKCLYVLEELAADFEFVYIDLFKGEQKSEDFRSKTPIGKVPLLEHRGEYLFESGAICRYAANVVDSPLYPDDKMQRAQVDQWMDFFTCHLGRWFTKLYFEQVIREKAGYGKPDEAGCAEAVKFAHQQLQILEERFATTDWLANDAVSIADLFAYAYVEQYRDVDFPLADYVRVKAWFDRIEARDSIVRAKARISALAG